MSYAATRSSGADHRSHSNSNLHNSNSNNNNINNNIISSGGNSSANLSHHHQHHSHHNHHHHNPHHPHPHHHHHHHHHHHLQPLTAPGGSSSSSISSTSSSSTPQQQAVVAPPPPPQQVVADPAALAPNDNTHVATITAGHADATAAAALAATTTTTTTCLGPPHYVDLHVNAGECVSLQLFDGQEQLVAGPATITLVSQQQNPPVPIPVQVPPGHMIHQIADENGTLKHIILSVMDPSAPPADATGQLDSAVITLPQGGIGGAGGSFWNSDQAGAIYQPPSYNNIVANGIGQNNYHHQQPQPPTGGPPSGAIYSNGKQQPALVVPGSGYHPNSTTLSHGPHNFRAGGNGRSNGAGSISPMRSRAKGHNHNHNHHHHHHHNNHNHSHGHNHHHQQQQQHHNNSNSSGGSNIHNGHQNNNAHYHPTSISNNIDHSDGNYGNHGTYNHEASFATPATKPEINPKNQPSQPEPAVAAKQVPTALATTAGQQVTVAHQAQDKSGPAWQPGNKFNHDQQQVQSKSVSPASGQGITKHQKAASPAPAQTSTPTPTATATNPSPETSGTKASNKTSNNNSKQQRDPSTTKSAPIAKSGGTRSKERQQQPTVELDPQQQSPVMEETSDQDTTRVSRGKQKKQRANQAKSEQSIDRGPVEVSRSRSAKARPIQQPAGEAIKLSPKRDEPKACVADKRDIESVVEESIIEDAAIVVESPTLAAPGKSLAINSASSTGDSKSSQPASTTEDDDDDDHGNNIENMPAPLSKKKSISVDSSKRRRSSKGAETPKTSGSIGGLKLNALPQLKILNLNCTSVTSSSVQLRWSYVQAAPEKYGIQHNNNHQHHSKHTHILDHFVIETSAEKNADTNQLIAPRIVYQGCAMTCRVAHLQVDKIHHFRVRRTALVNAPTESGCPSTKQEHLVVSEILSVTLASIQQPVQQQQQQSKKKGTMASGMVISLADTGCGPQSSNNNNNVANRGNASSHHSHSSNHHHHNHHHHHSGGASIKLSNLSKQCRTKIVSMFDRMVKNSLSSCSDTKFAGLLLVLFTIFAMLLAIFIHLYFVAPVIE